jgi:hypothetical protein
MTKFSVVAQNVTAIGALLSNNRWMKGRKQLCLRCQKDKYLKGGSIKFIGTFRTFICLDCKTAELQEQNP